MIYELHAAVFETELGWCAAVECDGRIIRTTLPAGRKETLAEIGKLEHELLESVDNQILSEAHDAVRAYLAGESLELDFPIDISGVKLEAADRTCEFRESTEFERDVWNATRMVSPGTVETYGGLARAVGRPRAARAVGNALGKNPLPLVVPCHRVISSGGGTGGFGGGVELKMRLLALEGAGEFLRVKMG